MTPDLATVPLCLTPLTHALPFLLCHVHILVYCLRTIRYGLGRYVWGEIYTQPSSDKGSSLQPWLLSCPTNPYSQLPHTLTTISHC